MASARLSIRFVRGFLLLFVPPTVVAAGILLLLYSLGVQHHPAALVVSLVVGLAVMVAYLAFMVHGTVEALTATLHEIQLDTEMMAMVDSAHRLQIQTGDELESLAATINRLGERLFEAQGRVRNGAAETSVGTLSASPASSLSDATPFTLPANWGERIDRERPIAEVDCVVFDCETTGFDHDGRDRIVSIAGVRIHGGSSQREDVFDALVNPGRPIPPTSAALHGITDAMVAGAPPIEEILPKFEQFARGAVLAGHQVWFDLRLLDRERLRIGLLPFTATHAVLDTALLARLVSGSLADLGLDGISHRLGIRMEGRHSALGDALATAEIYVRLLALLRGRGITTLGQALDAAVRLQDATFL